MSILPTFSELGLDKLDKDDIYQEMAAKAAELLKDKGGHPLLQVKIKGHGYFQYIMDATDRLDGLCSGSEGE